MTSEPSLIVPTGTNGGRPIDPSAAEATHCVNEPWLIEPEDPLLHYLYLKTPGFRLTGRNVRECPTKNRIIIYPATDTQDRVVVCPVENNISSVHGHHKVVDLLSGGWNESAEYWSKVVHLPRSQQQHARSFVVEFLQEEPGFYVITWMAISRRLAEGHFVEPCPFK